jgi:hypothetical protein
MFADETISALALARLHVALVAGRTLAIATAFCFGNFIRFTIFFIRQFHFFLSSIYGDL